MARPISEKCRRCAKQPVELAREKECWEGQKCHVRRSNYKKRDLRNRERRKQYRINQGASPTDAEVTSASGETVTTQVIAVPVPESYAAIVLLWRQNRATISQGRGSRVRILLNDRRAVFHEPHPERVTDKGAVKSVREFLINAGIDQNLG